MENTIYEEMRNRLSQKLVNNPSYMELYNSMDSHEQNISKCKTELEVLVEMYEDRSLSELKPQIKMAIEEKKEELKALKQDGRTR